MPTPPPLSTASADRLGRAVECADSMVDDGVEPAQALAKAARDEGLPHGHVPILVRAFNTGRAVRQLGETDPWAKAADHPVSTADKVYSAISALDNPVAETKSSSDYTVPPYTSIDPQPEPIEVYKPITASVVKQASAPVPIRRDTRVSQEYEAAETVDAIRDAVLGLPAPTYVAVKQAAAHACPEAADVFSFIEARHALLAAKTSSAIDPTVTTKHPIVVLIQKLAAVRSSYTVPDQKVPDDCTVIGTDEDRVWYTQNPKSAAVIAVNGSILIGGPRAGTELTIRVPDASELPTKSAADPSEPTPKTPAPSLPGVMGTVQNWGKGIKDYYAPKKNDEGETYTPGTALGRGFHKTLHGAASALVSNPVTGPAMRTLSVRPDKAIGAASDKLDNQLKNIDDQSALQDVVADKRLTGADPKMVIETYQTLSKLAPEAMKNPSIAADFIHRRIHTGPPSLFDLNQLVTLEKSLAQISKYRTGQDADEDS